MKTAKSKSALPAIVSMALLMGTSIQIGCGGSSSTSSAGDMSTATPGNNVAVMTVNSGPPELQTLGGTVNTGFIDVKICAPGTSTCQTVNFVDVDTGSVGLRILASKLSVGLPTEKDASSNTIAECTQFMDGFTWGPVQTADISIVGTNEQATSVPIQVVNDNNSFTGPPSSCSAASLGNDNNIKGLGAYAILGIGNFRQDCGLGCAQPVGSQFNPGSYYTCTSSGTCNTTSVSLAQQLQNPVSLFQTDNNGTVIEMPDIPAQGAATATGSLVFGIDTQSNNALGSATKLMLDGRGTFTTTFGPAKTPYPGSFIDSGSNGIYFLDTSRTGIPTCTNNTSFYCPTNTETLSAVNQGTNSVSSTVTFSVANANNLSAAFSAFNDLAGTHSNPPVFDFGMPFFYGRHVFTGLESVSNGQPTDTGQFVAY